MLKKPTSKRPGNHTAKHFDGDENMPKPLDVFYDKSNESRIIIN